MADGKDKRQETFKRLAPRRLNKATESLRILGNLGNYKPTLDQGREILGRIYDGLRSLEFDLTGYRLPEADDVLPQSYAEMRELLLREREERRRVQVQLEICQRENAGLLAQLSQLAVRRAGGVYGD